MFVKSTLLAKSPLSNRDDEIRRKPRVETLPKVLPKLMFCHNIVIVPFGNVRKGGCGGYGNVRIREGEHQGAGHRQTA